MNKFIVIADSGSSKTDWVVINESGERIDKIRTIGFNPYFQTSEFILSEVEEAFSNLGDSLHLIEAVYFYGAGCSSPEKNLVIEKGLHPIFRNAKINVYHDLDAAAVATLGDSSGIACIIGTGSNSCVWSGEKVIANIPSHGYIFGDEASGSYLGKELLRRYLMGSLDSDLCKSFEDLYGLDKEQILNSTYREPSPNVYLAKFAKFYSSHAEHPTLISILEEGFNKFFEVRILPYDNYKAYPLGFVGSIAFYFHPVLKRVAEKYGMQIANVVQCPIDALVAYHAMKIVSIR
jgi:glucosamine kinase